MRHSMRMLVKDSRLKDGIDVKDNVKGSKSRSQSMKEQAYNKEQRERPRPHELNNKSNLIDLMKEWLWSCPNIVLQLVGPLSDISELRLQEHLRMLVLVTSGDARSSHMISGDAKSWIMSPTMTTRSASRPAVASQGGGTGGRASRGGGRTRGCFGDQDDGRNDGQGGQVGG
ncbi:hypothetical protein Tco_0516217 [Tanacetum coccineum]